MRGGRGGCSTLSSCADFNMKLSFFILGKLFTVFGYYWLLSYSFGADRCCTAIGALFSYDQLHYQGELQCYNIQQALKEHLIKSERKAVSYFFSV